MPTPRADETQSEFVSRCVPLVIEDQGLDKDKEQDRQQAVAICYSMWRRAREGKGMDEKAVWTTAYINDLPDSAFLYIEPGGKKDEQGKTAPRTMRHFPYRDAGGAVDLPHLRNAIARIPQSNAPGLTPEKKRSLQERARRILAQHSKGVVLKGWDGASLTVAGYGAVWGGKDFDGDHFRPDTDFWFDRITQTPMVLYDHGFDEAVKRSVVGRVAHKTTDDYGLWIEAQLDRAAEYAEAITELVESGKLGWSSGAVSHLVERDEDGFLRSWPTVEFSLTPTPCEPRTLGVQALRSLAEADPAVKAFLPEGGDEETPPADATRGPDEARMGRAKALVFDVELSLEE